MGGLVIDTIRSGVQFTPEAASAFRRAEATVRSEFGRNIDTNSTYRSWSTQMGMYNAWNAYVSGRGPYPGHSKAVHPSESFHVQGVALDSDDWNNGRIRAILETNGFIRNRLYVANENHHFEYIRAQDKNYGKPALSGGASTEEDEMSAEAEKQIAAVYAALYGARNLTGKPDSLAWSNIGGDVQKSNYGVLPIIIHNQTLIAQQSGRIAAIEEVVEQLAKGSGAILDMGAISAAAELGTKRALSGLVLTADTDG